MIRSILAKLLVDERVRFTIVGAINTAAGYLLFALFELTVGPTIGYLGSLYISYAIAVCLAFVLHRGFTFRIVGTANAVGDFLRFASVYVVSLAINTVALPGLVELAGLKPLVAQAIIVVLTTLLSYFGHKFFSFRRAAMRKPGGLDGHD